MSIRVKTNKQTKNEKEMTAAPRNKENICTPKKRSFYFYPGNMGKVVFRGSLGWGVLMGCVVQKRLGCLRLRAQNVKRYGSANIQGTNKNSSRPGWLLCDAKSERPG